MAASLPDGILDLLHGPLRPAAGPFVARLGDLRPAFLPKGSAGRGHRAVARNGRVLLASDGPLEALAGRVARIRIQTWHRRILPGDAAEPHGVLLCVRAVTGPEPVPVFEVSLCRAGQEGLDLGLDVGGRLVLAFRRAP